MAGVFRETRIEYDGKEYWFTPSNKFLRRVDAGLAPQTLLGVVATMDGRNVPIPALAYIISEMVKEGGGDVDEDDVLGELYADLTNNNGNGIGPLVQAIGDCITPPDIASKNPTAPTSVGAKKPKSQRK